MISYEFLVFFASCCRVFHHDDSSQFNSNQGNESDHSGDKYTMKKEYAAIDFNYNTSLESSRNTDESGKSRSPRISEDLQQKYEQEPDDEEEAQDLSMSSYETINHVVLN